jgi:hypothetical protein
MIKAILKSILFKKLFSLKIILKLNIKNIILSDKIIFNYFLFNINIINLKY